MDIFFLCGFSFSCSLEKKNALQREENPFTGAISKWKNIEKGTGKTMLYICNNIFRSWFFRWQISREMNEWMSDSNKSGIAQACIIYAKSRMMMATDAHILTFYPHKESDDSLVMNYRQNEMTAIQKHTYFI